MKDFAILIMKCDRYYKERYKAPSELFKNAGYIIRIDRKENML